MPEGAGSARRTPAPAARPREASEGRLRWRARGAAAAARPVASGRSGWDERSDGRRRSGVGQAGGEQWGALAGPVRTTSTGPTEGGHGGGEQAVATTPDLTSVSSSTLLLLTDARARRHPRLLASEGLPLPCLCLSPEHAATAPHLASPAAAHAAPATARCRARPPLLSHAAHPTVRLQMRAPHAECRPRVPRAHPCLGWPPSSTPGRGHAHARPLLPAPLLALLPPCYGPASALATARERASLGPAQPRHSPPSARPVASGPPRLAMCPLPARPIGPLGPMTRGLHAQNVFRKNK
nr:proline-rich protein 36-like [Aegilops tauschii subsp. strangulata]